MLIKYTGRTFMPGKQGQEPYFVTPLQINYIHLAEETSHANTVIQPVYLPSYT